MFFLFGTWKVKWKDELVPKDKCDLNVLFEKELSIKFKSNQFELNKK